MPGSGIKVKPATTRNTSKATVLANLVADQTGRSSSNDAGRPRPEQQLMNESLQVPHPFAKGKTLDWGAYKALAKTHATQFRDQGIRDLPAHQQQVYATALKNLKQFPAQAVDNYQNTRVAERTQLAIKGVEKKPSGQIVPGGTPVYKKGTRGIKVGKKGGC